MTRRVALWMAVLAGIGFGACAAESERPRVIATILPIYCIATNVAGDLADVRFLIGAGGDAHDYQLTPRNRSDLERSRLLLMNGLGIEPWLKKIFTSTPSTLRVIELTRGLESQLIPGSAGHDHHHDDGDRAHSPSEMNPHVWLDPRLMIGMVTNALRGFQELDPANAARYQQNAATYVETIHALDRTLADGLREFSGSTIVTYHDAFPYFARRYGLTVAGVVEEIPDVEPTARHLARLGETIRSRQVRAIFVEPRHSRRLADRLGRDFGVRVGTLDTLETGPAERDAYVDGMRRLLDSFRKTLR